VPYFHVVYTLPAPIADIAYHNKADIYDLLFKVSAETTLTIAGGGSLRPLPGTDAVEPQEGAQGRQAAILSAITPASPTARHSPPS